jgi:isorenieratene synthase
MNDRAVVVGGGLAGLAAATVLAERGVPVTVLERERFLGGRAGSWSDTLNDGTTFEMERGFHAFFRQYYNVRSLLRRVDPDLACLVPLADYPLLGPNGWAESFAGLPRRAPLNLMTLMWRTPSMRLTDVLKLHMKAAQEMVAFDPAQTYARWDDVTAQTYLDSLRFPPRARRMLFDVFAHSFFNPEEQYSAAELLAMFHFYFLGNPEGLVFDVLRKPFGKALFEPLQRWLQERGVELRLGTSVENVTRHDGAFRVHVAGGEPVEGGAVILATAVPALQGIVARSPELGGPRFHEEVASLGVTNRFAVLRLWLDRPLRADRAPFAGTSGIGILDNISIYEKLEDESAAWAERTGGTIVELHAYALEDAVGDDEARRRLIDDLYAVYPEAKSATILEERLLVRRDCPSFAPGSHAKRPGVVTDTAGLLLAGDFVKLPFPSALMERAVTSGFLAANAILRKRGLREEDVRTIPPRGMLAKSA